MLRDILLITFTVVISVGGLLVVFFVGARWWIAESLKRRKEQEVKFNQLAVDFAGHLAKAGGKALREEGRKLIDYLLKETGKGAEE